MVQCSSCGKVIDRIPTWMESISVEYVCNNCPNRASKNIALMAMEAAPIAKPVAVDDDVPAGLEDEEPEEEL